MSGWLRHLVATTDIRLVLVGTHLQAVPTAASNVVVKAKLAKLSSADSSSIESEGKFDRRSGDSFDV
jgi:hypothetical protein